ncbi:MAG: hypothetical protein LBB83_00805, partial [Treponema sp.]|nr:hypothetical protein [Treponema sp.]
MPNHETDTEHASQVQAADTVPEPPPAQKAFRWQEHVNEKEILFPQAFEEASRLIEKALLPGKAIAVPETTGKEHPYIKKTRKVLERKKINPGKNASRYNQGLIHSFGKELFNVNVGPASVQRALNILKILCAEFEKQGFALVSEPDRYNRNRYDPVCVVIMDQKIAFSLTEDTTKTEIKNKNMYYTEYEYTPTGRLVLQHSLHQPGKYEQRQWNDTEQTPLEKRVPEIMTALILAAAWKRESTAREEERAREEAIEKEKARRSAINKQRIINFRKG